MSSPCHRLCWNEVVLWEPSLSPTMSSIPLYTIETDGRHAPLLISAQYRLDYSAMKQPGECPSSDKWSHATDHLIIHHLCSDNYRHPVPHAMSVKYALLSLAMVRCTHYTCYIAMTINTDNTTIHHHHRHDCTAIMSKNQSKDGNCSSCEFSVTFYVDKSRVLYIAHSRTTTILLFFAIFCKENIS